MDFRFLFSDTIVALVASLETVINHALQYDPATRQQIAAIEDVLLLEILLPSELPNLTVYCSGFDGGVRLQLDYEHTVSAHLKGSPIALIMLLTQPNTLAKSGVELIGSVGLLRQWQQSLQTLDIDWEEAINRVVSDQYFGDVIAPTVIQFLKRKLVWGREQHYEHARLLVEYLIEELHLIPSKPELQSFYRDVQELVQETERVAAYIAEFRQGRS